MLRRNGLSRNAMVTGGAHVGRMLGVPRFRRRSPTSSSRAGSSIRASRASAATPAHTNTCSRSPASAGTSARAALPKRLAIWTQWLDTTLLAPVPHRQVVLTIPKRLRAYCLYRRRLLGEIARVAARTVTAAMRTLTGERALAVGIVACLQTHGSRANWHPHLHLLVADGGFRPDGSFVRARTSCSAMPRWVCTASRRSCRNVSWSCSARA